VFRCCQHLRRADCRADYAAVEGDDPGTVLMRGGSAIIGPLGQLLAGPVYNENAILTAEIDLAEIARSKYDFDVVGHYARPDIFQLHVNEKATPPVVTSLVSNLIHASLCVRLPLLKWLVTHSRCGLRNERSDLATSGLITVLHAGERAAHVYLIQSEGPIGADARWRDFAEHAARLAADKGRLESISRSEKSR
jgi:hypothetical protein